MIKMENIKKSYKNGSDALHVIDDVTFTVSAGETVAISGKSGAGKTTLLNLIGCLDRFDSGRYFLNDLDTTGMKEAELARMRNEYIGFVMQDFALINHRSVLFNTMLPLLFSKVPYGSMEKMAIDALDLVGMRDYSTKKVSRLSGGERQRVAIARALVNHPAMILADEPTGALDSETGTRIIELLMSLNAQKNLTLIIVTHDAGVASYCKRNIMISDGKIV